MTTMQIISLAAAGCVALIYAWPLVAPLFTRGRSPELLTHLRNIISVRDTYRTPEVTKACNDLMEALLGIR